MKYNRLVDREHVACANALRVYSRAYSMSVAELSVRTFDNDGFRRRASALVIRDSDVGRPEVILVASRKRPDTWILPGGGIEPGEESAVAAAREAQEEAGVLCRGAPIFLCCVDNEARRTRTSLYQLKLEIELDDYIDAKTRARRWVPLQDAAALLVHNLAQLQLLERGLEAMGSGVVVSSAGIKALRGAGSL